MNRYVKLILTSFVLLSLGCDTENNENTNPLIWANIIQLKPSEMVVEKIEIHKEVIVIQFSLDPCDPKLVSDFMRNIHTNLNVDVRLNTIWPNRKDGVHGKCENVDIEYDRT